MGGRTATWRRVSRSIDWASAIVAEAGRCFWRRVLLEDEGILVTKIMSQDAIVG